MRVYEYRVLWTNPRGSSHVERHVAVWAARERVRQLRERGMRDVRIERRPVAPWERWEPES